MFRSILPKQYCFYDFFEKHIALSIVTCRELLAVSENGGDIATSAQKIKDLEHQCDEITHRCIEALHKTFITPIERTDVHRLIKRLDDIVDFIDNVSSHYVLYEIDEIRVEAKQLAEILLLCTLEIEKALQAMRNLKDPDGINKNCIAIHDLENKADVIMRDALKRLFREKDPILIIKWKELYERLEKAVDRCENVANIIEGVVISAS